MKELPTSLEKWNNYNLVVTFDYTKNQALKTMILKEIMIRSAFNYLAWN